MNKEKCVHNHTPEEIAFYGCATAVPRLLFTREDGEFYAREESVNKEKGNWEDEFDNQFAKERKIVMEFLDDLPKTDIRPKIKEFIRNLLTSQKEKDIAVLEELIISPCMKGSPASYGNARLREAIKRMREE